MFLELHVRSAAPEGPLASCPLITCIRVLFVSQGFLYGIGLPKAKTSIAEMFQMVHRPQTACFEPFKGCGISRGPRCAVQVEPLRSDPSGANQGVYSSLYNPSYSIKPGLA